MTSAWQPLLITLTCRSPATRGGSARTRRATPYRIRN